MRASPPSDRPRPRGGFTILEILIATAILTIGLMGLLACFPVAMKLGKLTIEQTTAGLVAQSVEQAIRDGIQTRKGQSATLQNTYFLFQHDGVEDPLPRRLGEASPSADNYVLLPTPDEQQRQSVDRGDWYARGKVFVYPETDGKTWTPIFQGIPFDEIQDLSSGAEPNGGGNPERADNDGDDYEDTDTKTTDFEVLRTYSLSDRFLRELDADDDETDREGDPIAQYSYAFAIRPAFRDASLDRSDPLDRDFIPAGELYEVQILVFRSFLKGTTGARSPILRKTVLIHR